MAIAVTCACGCELLAEDEHVGRRVRCPRCQKPVPVPLKAPKVDEDPSAPIDLGVSASPVRDKAAKDSAGKAKFAAAMKAASEKAISDYGSDPTVAYSFGHFERHVLRAMLYYAMVVGIVQGVNSSGGADISRERQTLWVCAAVAAAGLAASSKGNR